MKRMRKKAISNKKISHATFVYIPESESSIRSLRIPLWFPKAVVITLAGLIIFLVICLNMIKALNYKYDISRSDIDKLTDVNNSQKSEIENLRENAAAIQKQLVENSKAMEDVKKAVGITSSDADDNEETKTKPAVSSDNVEVNYSSPADVEVSTSGGSKYLDYSNDISNIKTKFASLMSDAQAQKDYIDTSVETVNKRIEYLRVLPSIKPIDGILTAKFGYRKNPFTSRGTEFHPGIDLAAPYGSSVHATADGTVIFEGWHGSYGNLVIISHGNGITTWYGHNSKILVKKGDKVTRGQVISKVGSTGRSTGPHVHYEIQLYSKSVDPTGYFK